MFLKLNFTFKRALKHNKFLIKTNKRLTMSFSAKYSSSLLSSMQYYSHTKYENIKSIRKKLTEQVSCKSYKYTK